MRGDERWLLALLVLTMALGVAYIVVMPPGLPYDEPSHWFNVRFYVEHHRLPVIGEPGVTYEAQMGPVAYVVFALGAAPWWQVSQDAAFYAARTVGLLELVALVVVVWRLARKVFPGQPGAALLAAALVGVNPMLLAMSTSVQNDTLAIVLAALAVDVATSSVPERRRSLMAGLLVGLALLTKVTMWPVGLALGLSLLWQRRYSTAVGFGVIVLLLSGWWFVRNLLLYGDLTGRAGLEAAEYDFPPMGWQPGYLARSVVTYLWIPVEYVRNTVEAPLLVEALVVLLTLVGLVGAGLAARALGTTGRLLAGIAGVAVIGWLVVVVLAQAVAFRFAYAALPAWFVAWGALATHHRWRSVGVAGLVATLGLNVWFLLEVQALTDPGMLQLTSVQPHVGFAATKPETT